MDILASITEQEYSETTSELPAGFLFASIKNVGELGVSVNGVALNPGEAKSYPFVGKGYHAVPYSVPTGGTLRILVIV